VFCFNLARWEVLLKIQLLAHIFIHDDGQLTKYLYSDLTSPAQQYTSHLGSINKYAIKLFNYIDTAVIKNQLRSNSEYRYLVRKQIRSNSEIFSELCIMKSIWCVIVFCAIPCILARWWDNQAPENHDKKQIRSNSEYRYLVRKQIRSNSEYRYLVRKQIRSNSECKYLVSCA